MKKRHVKTFVEKFGISTVKLELEDFIKRMRARKLTDLEIYQDAPNIGIVYCPFSINDLWYDKEEPDAIFGTEKMVRLKVIEVTEEKITVCHYDDHGHSLSVLSRSHQPYLVEGNIVKIA